MFRNREYCYLNNIMKIILITLKIFFDFIQGQACIDEIPHWVECSENGIPSGALRGGKFGNESLFIGRAMHNRALTPGNILFLLMFNKSWSSNFRKYRSLWKRSMVGLGLYRT